MMCMMRAGDVVSISVDRIVRSTDVNVGPVVLRQIRELIAELLEIP